LSEMDLSADTRHSKYQDIIELERPVSRKHKPMSIYDRAAQFAPFAALTGHSEAIDETARLTEKEIILTEAEKEILDRKLSFISDMMKRGEDASIDIIYFEPDPYKEGGQYISLSDCVKRIDANKRSIEFSKGTVVEFERLYDIKADFFNE